MRKILGILGILALLVCIATPAVDSVSYSPPLTIYDESRTGWWAWSPGISPTLSDEAPGKSGVYCLKAVLANQPGVGSQFYCSYLSQISVYDELRFWFYGNNSGRIIQIMIVTSQGLIYYHFNDDWAGWRYVIINLRAPDAGSISWLQAATSIVWQENVGTAATYRMDKVQFFDTRATYMAMGTSDLRNSTVLKNFTVVANETNNKITFIGFGGSTFLYQPGTNVSRWQNISSNIFEFVTSDACTNWVVQWDGSTLSLLTAPSFRLPDPKDLFSLNAARAFFESRLGIFSYSVAMLIPLATYLKTKDPGVPAIVLLFFAAAGYALDPSLAPFAQLTIVGGFALLAYRIFWSRGK